MAELTLEDLVKRSLSLGILEMPQIQEIGKSAGTRELSVDEFCLETLRRGFLTKYQMERLKFGETTGFFFGDYKVLYLVGAGSFARFYSAVNRRSKRLVALKVLRSRFMNDPVVVDEFLREAELGMDLHHPNIVGIYEALSDADGRYMVMDFVEGQTLRDTLKAQKVMLPKIATRVMTDVCMALDYAFKRGHSHRDLKLSNVILSSAGKAVLIDFGLAAKEQDSNDKTKNQRAVDYAALEKMTGVNRNDRRSDIYFAGTMFYHLLAGVAPLLETSDRAKRMERQRFLNVRPLREKNPAVPPVLGYIVEKAMSIDPERRYQSPGEILHDLQQAAVRLETGKTAEFLSAKENPTTTTISSAEKTILVVEAKPELQEIFRAMLKRAGHKVLVVSDTDRAVDHFDYEKRRVDCILLNAQYIGVKAVLAFNQLAESRLTVKIPAVLLLDEQQIKWAAKAIRSKHRVTVGMPISMHRLLEVINKLLTTPVENAEVYVAKKDEKSDAPIESKSDASIRAAAAVAQIAVQNQLSSAFGAAPGSRQTDRRGLPTSSSTKSQQLSSSMEEDLTNFTAAFDAALDDVLNNLDAPPNTKK